MAAISILNAYCRHVGMMSQVGWIATPDMLLARAEGPFILCSHELSLVLQAAIVAFLSGQPVSIR